MTKTTSVAMDTHLASNNTTLATLCKVTRVDGLTFGFSDHDQDLDFDVADGGGTVTYEAANAYVRSNVKATEGFSIDNMNITGFLDGVNLVQSELRAGLWDFAEYKFFLVNWKDLSQGPVRLTSGRFAKISMTDDIFQTELLGLMNLYTNTVVRPMVKPCLHDLGDTGCQIFLPPPLWLATTAYVERPDQDEGTGNVVSTSDIDINNLYNFKCSKTGTSGGSEPTWNTSALGATTFDGGANWETLRTRKVRLTVDQLIGPVRFRALLDWGIPSATVETIDATSLTVPVPDGTQEGDMIIAFIGSESGIDYPVNGAFAVLSQTNNHSNRATIGWRIASSEPADYTFTQSNVEPTHGTLITVKRPKSGFTPQITVINANQGGTVVSMSAITPSEAPAMILRWAFPRHGTPVGSIAIQSDFTGLVEIQMPPTAFWSGGCRSAFKFVNSTAEVPINNDWTVPVTTPDKSVTISITLDPVLFTVFETDYFNQGRIEWVTGNNAGLKNEVTDYTSEGVFTMFDPTQGGIQIGDTFDAFVGCDKLLNTCINKFDNIFNFGGFPYIPGNDLLFKVPDVPPKEDPCP